MIKEIDVVTNALNDHLAGLMKMYMAEANGGDETPEQAFKWDAIVHELATLIVEIRNQNN